MKSDRSESHRAMPPWPLSVLTAPERKISNVFDELPTFKREIESFHPIKSAVFVAGLLTIPELHANTVRIELLVHLLMAFAKGEHQPSTHRIDVWLNRKLGTTSHSRLEDPVEDVFVSNVTTEDGNFRIFEGTWESNDFYLQRLLNIVKTLPDDESSRQLKREIKGVLKISDEVAARCHLSRFTPGGGKDKGVIPVPPLEHLKSHSNAVTFSQEELWRLDVSPDDLSPFVWQMDSQDRVKKQALGDSDFTRSPLVYDSDNLVVLLPAALSIALRQHVLKWMYQTGYQKSFDENLVSEYRNFLFETPILGQIIPRELFIPSKLIAGKTFLEFSVEIDAGRYLQIIAIVDSLSYYLNYGLSVSDDNVRELSNELESRINKAKSYFNKQQGFKQGLTLVIGCGYGRPSYFHTPKETSDWRFEFVSAQDFYFLAWAPEASPLFLWKLVDHERFISDHGVSVFNANGLLNLYGWWSETQYFMLIPEIPFAGDPVKLAIPTNSLANIRRKVRQGWDLRVLSLPSGRQIRVQRASAISHFPDEENRPKYGAIDDAINGNLLGAWVSEHCIWWVSAERGKTGLSRDLTFRVWDAVIDWLELAAPIIERHVQEIAGKAIFIILDFNEALKEDVDPVPAHVLASFLDVSTDLSTNTVRIGFKDPFFGGFRNPKNAAEREIIRALATGVGRIGDRPLDDNQLNDIINQIFLNEDARYIHMFEAASFRDYIRTYDRPAPLLIDESDEARTKLGVGWLVRNRSEGDRITEVDKSVFFLNRVVDVIWKRMRPQFQKLDRTDFIERALLHIEGVEADMLRWKRTMRAVLALRRDKTSAKAIAIHNIGKCKAAELALRLIIEMALSECPLEGGQPVGLLDLTRLMADVLYMFHIGGWSDAILKGVMQPDIHITPSGDILSHKGFIEKVVDPLGQHFESTMLDRAVSSYEDHYEPIDASPSVRSVLPDDFLSAFKAEFGFSIDELSRVRESLEKFAVEKKKCVVVCKKDEILSHCAINNLVTPQSAEIILNHFDLWPRESWDTTPDGYSGKDWYPWRFGRQLSLIRRPIVRLENEDNPRYILSPGLFGVCVLHTVSRYYEADVGISECKSREMRQWIDREKNRAGHAFARKVFEAMQAQGYEARLENKVTSLLNEKLDQDYGDVDVLAWKAGGHIVLVIECKDLKFAKTPNELAEQLNSFSGQTSKGGKRDDLLKHLDRCNLLTMRSDRLAKAIGITGKDIQIRRVVCFSTPVPMQYVAERFPNVSFLTLNEITDKL